MPLRIPWWLFDVRRRSYIGGWCRENKKKNEKEQFGSALIEVVIAFPLRLLGKGYEGMIFHLISSWLIRYKNFKFVSAQVFTRLRLVR